MQLNGGNTDREHISTTDSVLTFPAEALEAIWSQLVVEAQRDDQNPSIQRHQERPLRDRALAQQ